MKFTNHANANGTSLQGYVTATYDALVEVFGKPKFGPNEESGDGKVSCEWCLRFEDNTVVTIYDWKEGSTPMDEYKWHVGGHSNKAMERLWEAVGESQQKLLTQTPNNSTVLLTN